MSSLIVPATLAELTKFYLFWTLAFVTINLIWDIRSPHTPAFHLTHLNRKVSVLYNATSFASSLLILSGMFSLEVRKIAGDTIMPLLLAGLSGITVSLAELCPYKKADAFIGPPAP